MKPRKRTQNAQITVTPTSPALLGELERRQQARAQRAAEAKRREVAPMVSSMQVLINRTAAVQQHAGQVSSLRLAAMENRRRAIDERGRGNAPRATQLDQLARTQDAQAREIEREGPADVW